MPIHCATSIQDGIFHYHFFLQMVRDTTFMKSCLGCLKISLSFILKEAAVEQQHASKTWLVWTGCKPIWGLVNNSEREYDSLLRSFFLQFLLYLKSTCTPWECCRPSRPLDREHNREHPLPCLAIARRRGHPTFIRKNVLIFFLRRDLFGSYLFFFSPATKNRLVDALLPTMDWHNELIRWNA